MGKNHPDQQLEHSEADSMRIAFTIILNGLHHLKHNNYAEFLLDTFDYWVVVEGASESNGDTSWCKTGVPAHYSNEDGSSIDGTTEYLQELKARHKNLIHILPSGPWQSKTKMVNAAAAVINSLTDHAFVWEIDADEQWTKAEIEAAEKELVAQGAKTGTFLCNCYVGKDLMAVGEWGEGLAHPIRRLWDWRKDTFFSHEPPELQDGNGKTILLFQRFEHYAYYYEKDVQFKNDWYTGHENILQHWRELQAETEFPQPISRLIEGHWGQTKTMIYRMKSNG